MKQVSHRDYDKGFSEEVDRFFNFVRSRGLRILRDRFDAPIEEGRKLHGDWHDSSQQHMQTCNFSSDYRHRQIE